MRHGCQFAVFMVSCQSEHIQIAACGPWVAGDVANSDGDEHQGALAVGKVTHDAGATSDLPVQPFNHVVGVDPFTVLDRWSSLMAPSSIRPSLYRVLAGTWAEMMLPAGGGIKPFLRSHHRPAWRPGNFGATPQITEVPATHPNDIRSLASVCRVGPGIACTGMPEIRYGRPRSLPSDSGGARNGVRL